MIYPCAYCGKEFKTKRKGKKYCCADCRTKSRKGFRPTQPRICAYCNASYMPKTYTQQFCSKSCSSKFRHKKWKDEDRNLNPFQNKQLFWSDEPWSTIVIYGAFNIELPDARRPDFKLGY